eukprot:191227_1
MGLVLDESEFMCIHHIDGVETKIAQLHEEELDKATRQDELKKFYQNEMVKLNQIVNYRPGKEGEEVQKEDYITATTYRNYCWITAGPTECWGLKNMRSLRSCLRRNTVNLLFENK